MRANGVDGLKKGRAQPFYHVLADTRDRPGAPVMYVAHENVMVDTPPEPLRHPLLSEFFAGFDAQQGFYLPNDALRERYPEVKATTDRKVSLEARGDAPAGGAAATDDEPSDAEGESEIMEQD